LPEREQVDVTSRGQWRRWLVEHAGFSPGCWAVTWRRGSSGPVVGYEDLVEEALCVGWIDSHARRVDEGRTGLLFTPRRPGSGWARSNKERVDRLQAAGLMLPGGQAVVARARADGSWNRLDGVEDLVEPPDLAAALDADAQARATWDGFPRSTRRGILTWIVQARRPQTRSDRVAETVAAAHRGERADQRRLRP
jgi:uncharacterized protein YdeI (YjbR/CyaY-like superfamily)